MHHSEGSIVEQFLLKKKSTHLTNWFFYYSLHLLELNFVQTEILFCKTQHFKLYYTKTQASR